MKQEVIIFSAILKQKKIYIYINVSKVLRNIICNENSQKKKVKHWFD